MVLRALLLDLDGTIADSLPVLYEVYRKFLAQYGFEGSKEEFQSLNGPPLEEGVELLRQKYAISTGAKELYSTYCSLFASQYCSVLQPFPGTHAFLERALCQGLRLALVTSAPKEVALPFLRGKGLEELFEVVVTGDDVKEGKPHPDPYLMALEQLALSPEQALVVEDSFQGALSGVRAGVATVVIHHRHETSEVPEGILTTVTCWSQLEKILENRQLYVKS